MDVQILTICSNVDMRQQAAMAATNKVTGSAAVLLLRPIVRQGLGNALTTEAEAEGEGCRHPVY